MDNLKLTNFEFPTENINNQIINNNNNEYNNNNIYNQIEINKENEYKSIILKLENEIEKEKNLTKDISEENKNIIFEIKQKILKYDKEIKYYSIQNENQRKKLEIFSGEITNKINRINIHKILEKLKKSKKPEKGGETLNQKMNKKQIQLKNIMTIIKNNENENESLKSKIRNNKKDDNSNILKMQENKIKELQKQIKIKKAKLEEHLKCGKKKSDLINKLNEVKNEIEMHIIKNINTKNQKNIFEYKNKPKIILDKNNKFNTFRNSKNNKSFNLKLLNISNIEKNKINNISIIKTQKNQYSSQKKINIEEEEQMINIPYNVSTIFSEKELKAIYIGLDKNKSKYQHLLELFNINNLYINYLGSKHKVDIMQKLNKLNELDDEIKHMDIKNQENESDIQLYKEHINKLNGEKKLFVMRNHKLNIEIKNKKKIIERKDQEINTLGAQLIQLKQFIKNGDINSIKNMPKIEIEYEDENAENGSYDII